MEMANRVNSCMACLYLRGEHQHRGMVWRGGIILCEMTQSGRMVWYGGVVWRGDMEGWCGGVIWRDGVEG